MSALDPKSARPSDDAAMASVLAAEREAREALEQSTREAARILENAHRRTRSIAAAAARRVGAVRTAMERRIAARLAEIEALEREAARAHGLEPAVHHRLARAVEQLAAEASGEEP